MLKKKVPDFLIKWEDENKIAGYKWEYETITSPKGEVITTSSKRVGGIDENRQLVKLTKEISDYFEKKQIERKKKVEAANKEAGKKDLELMKARKLLAGIK